MPAKPQVLFFDAGGTLFRPYPSVGDVYAATARAHGVEVEAPLLEKAFHDAWHVRNGPSSLAGASSDKIERDWWYALVKEVFANHRTFADFEAFFADLYDRFARPEHWRLYEDSLPVLEELKRHYRLGMISNWDHRLHPIVEGLGLKPYLESITASFAVGVAKPNAGIFQQALASMKVSPEEALHVGDSLEDDYWGARRAGLKAVLLNRHRKPYNDVDTIETLRGLKQFLP